MTSEKEGDRPLQYATRWWRWFLSPVVIVVWLVAAVILGGFQSKLTDVQENDNAAFLPASAESTKVIEAQEKFRDSELLSTVIVYSRASGITEQDREAIDTDVQDIESKNFTPEEITPPADGREIDGRVQAVTVVVPLIMTDNWEESAKQVDEIRQITDDTNGMQVYVTGPGGLSADFADAFGDIDGLLLIVAAIVVVVILLIVYRSPILPVVVLLSVMMALGLASAIIYLLVKNNAIELNGQSQGILFVLVFGATTDYALLLIARYREELRRHKHAKDSMRTAFKAAVEPIVAAGCTVIVGLMCLLFSDLNSNKGLGPVAAIGIAGALIASLTFLPAALALLRRGAFWPFRPVYGSDDPHMQGLWAWVSRFVGRHYRLTWVVTSAVLLALALLAPQLDTGGLSQDEAFIHKPDSVKGQELLAKNFPAGQADPAIVITKASESEEVIDAIRQVDGVDKGAGAIYPTTDGPPGTPGPPTVADGLVELNVILTDPSDSSAARETITRLRSAVHDVPGADAIVGGFAAVSYDTQQTSARDLRVIIPIVLVVIFLILALLLRALVAPVLLIATVVLSFAATLGIAYLAFTYVFDQPDSDPAVPLFGFIFLVALGIDYNIFLMTRVREESIKHGTREGTLAGLRVTGGVITSAGIVLAATFSVLGVLPLVFLLQMSFIVAFGVLLDTMIVRSLLVPAATLELDKRVWLPSKLGR